MSKQKKQDKDFSISLVVGDKTYKGKGATAFDALKALPEPSKFIMLKTIVTLERDGKKRTYSLLPLRARRFFQRIARTYLAKELEILIK